MHGTTNLKLVFLSDLFYLLIVGVEGNCFGR